MAHCVLRNWSRGVLSDRLKILLHRAWRESVLLEDLVDLKVTSYRCRCSDYCDA